MAENISLDHIQGSQGLATYGYIKLLLEMGHEVVTPIQPRQRNLVYPQGLKREIVVKGDLPYFVNGIDWDDFDLAVFVGVVNPWYSSIDYSKVAAPMLISLENSPRLAKRLHQSTIDRGDILFFGDHTSIPYDMGIPVSRFCAVPVVLDFYNSDTLAAPSVNKLFYAGRIDKENATKISNHFHEGVDYYGKLVHKTNLDKLGEHYQGEHDPKTFYKENGSKYLGAISGDEPGVLPYESVEAMLAGVPVVVMNDDVWNSRDADEIYGPVQTDGRFRACAVSGTSFGQKDLLDALSRVYGSAEKRREIREHAKGMTFDANGHKMKEMVDRVCRDLEHHPAPVHASPSAAPNGGSSNGSVPEEEMDDDTSSADTVAHLAEQRPA